MDNSSKSGQITFYIVLGLVVLITVSFLFYLYYSISAPSELLQIPAEARPVGEYILDCARPISMENIILIGQKGGYLETPSAIENEKDSFLPIDPAGIMKVPFWYYKGTEREPTKAFLQDELNLKIKNQLLNCLDEFKSLKSQFNVTPLDEMQIKTQIGEESIFIDVQYPLSIQLIARGSETKIEGVKYKQDVSLGKVHAAAKAFMKEENLNQFLENMTIALMSSDPSIPMDGMSMDCKQKIWQTQNIKERLQEILNINYQNIRIKGSDHIPFEEPEKRYKALRRARENIQRELLEGLEEVEQSAHVPRSIPSDAFAYFNQQFDIGTEEAKDLRISISYHPSYDMLFNVRPSDNGIMSSRVARGPGIMGFMCSNTYHFTYDIIYPVLIRITDPNTRNGNGYTLQFATPVRIKNNDYGRYDFSIMPRLPIVQDTEFCTQLEQDTSEIRVVGIDDEGYKSYSGLDQVNLKFVCINRECDIGQTKPIGDEYKFRGFLPEGCYNPVIIAEKDGYLRDEKYMTTDKLELELIKLREVEVEVKKHPYFSKIGDIGTGTNLQNGEEVSWNIRLSNSDKLSEIGGMPSNDTTIELVDGTAKYDIDAYLSRRGKLIGGYSARNYSIKASEIGNKMILHVFEHLPEDKKGMAEMMLGTLIPPEFR